MLALCSWGKGSVREQRESICYNECLMAWLLSSSSQPTDSEEGHPERRGAQWTLASRRRSLKAGERIPASQSGRPGFREDLVPLTQECAVPPSLAGGVNKDGAGKGCGGPSGGGRCPKAGPSPGKVASPSRSET